MISLPRSQTAIHDQQLQCEAPDLRRTTAAHAHDFRTVSPAIRSTAQAHSSKPNLSLQLASGGVRHITQTNAISSMRSSATNLTPPIHPYYREKCVPKIQDYLYQRLRKSANAFSSTESFRIELVADTAEQNDSIFLFLHQVVSQSTIDLAAIPELLRDAPGFQNTMQLLNKVLAGAQIHRNVTRDLFIKLPCSLGHLTTELPDSYRTLVRNTTHLSISLDQE